MVSGDKRKLLFVGNTAWSMWNFRGDVISHFSEQGFDVVVAAPQDSLIPTQAPNVEFVVLKHLSRRGLNPIIDLKFCIELFLLFRKVKPEKTFLYTIKPVIYGSLASILTSNKVICFVTGMGYAFHKKNVLNRIVVTLFKVCRIAAYKIVFLNRSDLEDFKNLKIISPQSQKAVLFPGEGINLEHFSNISPTNLKNNTITFTFIGRLLKDKGIFLFLDAASKIKARFPKTRFVVVGPSDPGNPSSISESDLLKYVESGAIEYVGAKSDVRPFISASDALVVPTSYNEGLSRVVLESMAMGTPVIACRNRGVTPLVDNGATGYICEPNDLNDLIKKIEEFMNLTEESITQMRGACRTKVEGEYSMKSIIQHYDRLIYGN